jgi:hypothetical protein
MNPLAAFLKTDANGNQQILSSLGGTTFQSIGYNIRETNDNGYIIAGAKNYLGAYDGLLIKADSAGNQQWYRTYGGNQTDDFTSVLQTEDGGYYMLGSSFSFGINSYSIWLVDTDTLGFQQTQRIYGGDQQDLGKSMEFTNDGGYIIAGYTNTYGAGGYDVYLIRLGEIVLPAYSITLTPLNTPIQIPAGGGPFRFNLNITNNDTSNWIFDFWTKIIKPNGQIRCPAMLATFLFLDPNTQINVNGLAQYVPNYAPAGDYTYIGCVGTYPDNVVASDTFMFSKLAGIDAPKHNLGWACLGWDEDETAITIAPSEFRLYSPSPNPFNSSTTITFDLPDMREVELIIYDLSGREVWRLASGISHLGTNQVVWDAEGMPSGIYFAKLSAVGGQSSVQKLLLIR